jgi:hypothetical protein
MKRSPDAGGGERLHGQARYISGLAKRPLMPR